MRELFGSLRYRSFRGFWIARRSIVSLVIGCGRVNHGFNLRHMICRKAATSGMFMDHLFVRSDVNTVKLVVGDVALHPLDLWSQFIQHIARSLRQRFQLRRAQLAGPWYDSLNNILWHWFLRFLLYHCNFAVKI